MLSKMESSTPVIQISTPVDAHAATCVLQVRPLDSDLEPWVELWKHHWVPKRSSGASFGGATKRFWGPPLEGLPNYNKGLRPGTTKRFQLFR